MKEQMLAAGIKTPVLVKAYNDDAINFVKEMYNAGWKLVGVAPPSNSIQRFVFMNDKGEYAPHGVTLTSKGTWHVDVSVRTE